MSLHSPSVYSDLCRSTITIHRHYTIIHNIINLFMLLKPCRINNRSTKAYLTLKMLPYLEAQYEIRHSIWPLLAPWTSGRVILNSVAGEKGSRSRGKVSFISYQCTQQTWIHECPVNLVGLIKQSLFIHHNSPRVHAYVAEVKIIHDCCCFCFVFSSRGGNRRGCHWMLKTSHRS